MSSDTIDFSENCAHFHQILRDTPGVEMYVYPHREKAMPREEIAEQLRKGCDGLLCLLTDKIDREMVSCAPASHGKLVFFDFERFKNRNNNHVSFSCVFDPEKR